MNTRLSRRWIWLIVGLSILLLHLLTLLRYPPPFVDEAWLVSRAWAFKQTGHQYGPLDSGLVDQFAGIWILNQWFITALQALVLRFFSQPALLPLRALSLIEGFGLLAVSYWAVAGLSSRQVAIWSTLLLALSRIFMHTAHMVRYDILATLLGYTALAIVVNDRRGRFWFGLAAGLLAGLAMETHLNSLIFFPAIALVYLIEFKGMFYRKPAFWGFVLGSGLGAGFYLLLHVLPYPETYFAVNRLLFSRTQIPPILTRNPQEILTGFKNVGFLLLIGSGPMILLGLLAIPLLVRRRTKEGWKLMTINIALWVGAALVIPNSMGHYAIYLAPAFLWLVAEFLIAFFQQPWQGKWKDYASRAFVWGIMAGSIVLTIQLLIPNGYENYQQAQSSVNASVRPGDTLMGSQVYWFGLYDHRYYSWELLFLYPRLYPGKTLEDAMLYFKPDILVIDGNVQPYITDLLDLSDRWYDYCISRHDLYDFLNRYAQQIPIPENITYNGSPLQIYRIIWNP